MTTTIEVTILEPNVTIGSAPIENIVNIVVNEAGTINNSIFAGLMQYYNDNLLPFLTNEEAFNELGSGKEYILAQGSTEGQQGAKMITYTP